MRLTDKFENKAGVYIIRNEVNGKYYIGESVRMKTRMTAHISSRKQLIARSIQKYGVENFSIEVYYLEHFKKKDLIDLEEQMIKRYDCLHPKGYNILPCGTDQSGVVFSEERLKKMSEFMKGKRYALGYKHTEETKRKISLMQKGKKKPPFSQEHCKNISKSKKGRIVPLEERVARSEQYKGSGNPNFGKKHSDETRLKIKIGRAHV